MKMKTMNRTKYVIVFQGMGLNDNDMYLRSLRGIGFTLVDTLKEATAFNLSALLRLLDTHANGFCYYLDYEIGVL